MGKKRRAKPSSEHAPPSAAHLSKPATASPAADSNAVDPDVFASVLSVDYPLLDTTLILTIISDYVAAGTLHEHEQTIREQLGQLEAQVVADAADAADAEAEAASTYAKSAKSKSSKSRSVASRAATPQRSSGTLPSRPSSAFASISGSTAVTSVYDDMEESGPQSEADLLALFFPNLRKKDIEGALAAEPSLEAAVDHLLSVELIRGVERTGIWGDEPPEEDEGGEWVHVMSRHGSADGSGSGSEAASSSPAPTRSSKPASSASSSTLHLDASGADWPQPQRAPQPQPQPSTAPKANGGTSGKKSKRTLTLPIVDTLQRRPATPALCPVPRPPPTDVWSAFASLSGYLSEIAPRAAAPWFLSYLHAPDYYSAHDAVRAALSQLALTSDVEPPEDVIAILEAMYGILYDGEDEDSAQLRACVGAADANASDVMDLMDVLSDLRGWPDYEAARIGERDPFDLLAEMERGSTASTPGTSRAGSRPASAPPSRPATPQPHLPASRAVNANRLTRPVAPVTLAKSVSKAAPKSARAVPGSQASAFPSAHELHLPASSNWSGQATQEKHSGNWRATRPSSGAGKKRAPAPKSSSSISVPGPGGIGLGYASANGSKSTSTSTSAPSAAPGAGAADHFARADLAWSRRRDAMLATTAQFQAGGGAKHLQRQVAGFYRLRARELAADARAHALQGGREVVRAQIARDGRQIDLHHRTVAEAVTLASEAVDSWWQKREGGVVVGARGGGGGAGGDRFVVITGKGLHSAGQRGVLGPAVASSLRAEGWRVEEHPGYITVKGR